MIKIEFEESIVLTIFCIEPIPMTHMYLRKNSVPNCERVKM